MNIRDVVDLLLALCMGYFAGQGIGYRRANREYKGAIDLAVADYREANRLIQKLRNRLIGTRFLFMKDAAKKRAGAWNCICGGRLIPQDKRCICGGRKENSQASDAGEPK